MSEILLLKARLADKYKQLQQLKIRAEQHIISTRNVVTPYEDEFTDLDVDSAVIAVSDLKDIVIKGRELKVQIKKLEKELNG